MEHTPHHVDLTSAVTKQIRRLTDQRAELVRQLAEIDARLAQVAQVLNIASDSLVASPSPVKIDSRRAGSLIETAIQMLFDAENGYARPELKNLLKAHPSHADSLRRNENSYYNMVKRAVGRKEIEERNGRLYHPSKVPPEPSNLRPEPVGLRVVVPSLFAGEAR
jgi:hypothetical protein